MSDRSATHLLISCADRPGIVAAVSRFLYEQGANIVEADQYATEAEGGTFSMRMAFQLEGTSADDFERGFGSEVAGPLELEWRLTYPDEPRRVAVLVSREDHCLLDLLWRARRGDFEGEIVHVISNHSDHEPDVATFDVPFSYVPVEDDQRTAEREMLELLAGQVELVVLARYMRILSGEFLDDVRRLVHQHPSFVLPAFPGAEPYMRGRQSVASRSSAPPPTTSRKSWMKARSSSRTSRGCRIVTRPGSRQLSGVTSNASSLRARFVGISRIV
jgi:formyltetrahydrofolate deformylase